MNGSSLERALITHFHHFHPLCCNSNTKYTFKVQSHGQKWRYFTLPSKGKGGGGGVGSSSQPEPAVETSGGQKASSHEGEEGGATRIAAGGVRGKDPSPEGKDPSESEQGKIDPKGKGVHKGKSRDPAAAYTPFTRNVVAIGEGEQGGFEGVTATNRIDIPRDQRKFKDPQMEADEFQESLLEAPSQ